MTVPSLHVTSDSPLSLDVDVLVIGVQKTESGPRLLSDDGAVLRLQDSLAAIGITGAQDEVRRLPAVDGAPKSLALVGVGTTLGTNELRYASGSAARQLRGVASIALALPTATPQDALAVLEGAAIGAYSYVAYRSGTPDATKLPASSVTRHRDSRRRATDSGRIRRHHRRRTRLRSPAPPRQGHLLPR
jgi:leucyl aminopeptidase